MVMEWSGFHPDESQSMLDADQTTEGTAIVIALIHCLHTQYMYYQNVHGVDSTLVIH